MNPARLELLGTQSIPSNISNKRNAHLQASEVEPWRALNVLALLRQGPLVCSGVYLRRGISPVDDGKVGCTVSMCVFVIAVRPNVKAHDYKLAHGPGLIGRLAQPGPWLWQDKHHNGLHMPHQETQGRMAGLDGAALGFSNVKAAFSA